MRKGMLWLGCLLCAAAGHAETTAPASATNIVLELGKGSFRAFEGWKTPVLVAADGTSKPLLEPKRKDLKDEDRTPVPIRASDPPAASWTAVDFDDSGWPRVGGLTALNPNGIDGHLVCLRGHFYVTDPAKVMDLRLNVSYIGGAVAYVNGVELQRGHLPAAPEPLAARYADDAYVTTGNAFRVPVDTRDQQKILAFLQGRQRELPAKGAADGVCIPSAMLRKGVNIVAIEVRAAPVNELAVEKSVGGASWKGTPCLWAHALVASARLTSASSNDVISAVAPVHGIEFSNSQPLETVDACNRMLPGERIFPLRLVGARNGTFSGKVVLSSSGAIKNLKAAGSELVQAHSAGPGQAGGQGRIPAAAVQVRWAERITPQVYAAAHWDPLMWAGFDRLHSEFPAEIPVATLLGDRRHLSVVPVWVTVRVPADAPAGEYEGTVTIDAEGSAPVTFAVPVRLKVNGWTLPDPKNFVTHNDIYQSPDSVAEHYKVPLWSEKHFALIGKSLQVFQEVGNKLCIVNLTVDSRSLGNTESMVRWVKKSGAGAKVQGSVNASRDGASAPEPRTLNPDDYTYDFSIAERYMDTYEKTCGKPGILRLDAWQRARDPQMPFLCVSVLDPATGKVEPMAQPPYGTPENEAFWRPVFTGLRQRLEKRGWLDVAAVGWINYQHGPDQVNPKIVDVYKQLWPDGKWMQTTHQNPRAYGSMPVVYSEYVWGCGALYNPDAGGQYPRAWKSGAARIEMGFPRFGVGFIFAIIDGSPFAAYRYVTEAAQQGGLRGIGFVGGDFWPVRKLKPGDPHDFRYRPISYEFNGIGMSDSLICCFSPGPDGAAFNGRMEMFREGVQACEAIIFLQRALEDKKVDVARAQKINDLLDERARYYCRARGNGDNWLMLECSNWQARDDRLFALCAEVATLSGQAK